MGPVVTVSCVVFVCGNSGWMHPATVTGATSPLYATTTSGSSLYVVDPSQSVAVATVAYTLGSTRARVDRLATQVGRVCAGDCSCCVHVLCVTKSHTRIDRSVAHSGY